MSISSGYGLTNLSGAVELSLAKSQSRLQIDVSRLSSGLRINSAADDPSGMAISEQLQSKVNGYDQASDNVQTANNMLTVADGALQTVSSILQRLRSLAVQANDDLLSTDDRINIEAESAQLQAEVNAIAEKTNFNGIDLLNRDTTTDSHPYSQPFVNNEFATPFIGGTAYDPTGATWVFTPFDFVTGSGSGIAAFNSTNPETAGNTQPPPSGSSQIAFIQGGGAMAQQITTIPGWTYSVSFNIAQQAQVSGSHSPAFLQVFVDGTSKGLYFPQPADYGNPDWTTITTPTFIGTGSQQVSFNGVLSATVRTAFIDNVQLNVIPTPQQPIPNLQVHDGADEGNIVGLQLPTVLTSKLGIASDTVSNSATASAYETNIDTALDYIEGARATLGVQMVRLQYQAANDNTAAVNLTGSESNIRDADVAHTTTAFAQDQLLSSIGTAVLSNTKIVAALVEKLFQ